MGKNTWVAYIGEKYTKEDIEKALKFEMAGKYHNQKIKIEELSNAIFREIVYKNNQATDPVVETRDDGSKYIYVTSYREYFEESYNHFFYKYEKYWDEDYYEFEKRSTEKFKVIFGDINEVDGPHVIYDNAYQKYGVIGLKKLLRHGSFNYVNYDPVKNEYFACVGKKKTGNKGYNPTIYYNFLNDDKSSIVLSNTRDILMQLTDKIYELPDNTYMLNGIINDIEPDIKVVESEKFDDDFTNNINTMINKMVKSKLDKYSLLFDALLEDITEEYIKEFDINSILTKAQKTILINDVKKNVLNSVRDDLKASQVVEFAVSDFEKQLEETYKERINNYLSKIYVPNIYIINNNDNKVKQVEGVFHNKFESILTTVNMKEPVMIVGPAGGGKNYTVGQVSQSLNLPMYYTSSANNEFKLLGYMDANGIYHETPFYKAFTEGGVFMLDEIDASDPSALLVINSALANEYTHFPNSTTPIKMHENFRFVGAANTWGRGADLQYVGKNPLDASTIDRVDTIFFDYDEKMESILYPDDEVLEFMWNFRKAVFETRTPHIVSTRGIKKVYTKKINNIKVENAIEQNIIKGLKQDYLNILIGKLEEMKSISEKNIYYNEIKKLVLTKPKEDEDEEKNEYDYTKLPFN